MARVPDSRTWATFERAAAAYLADPTIAGLGFVFSADDPFVGVNMDGCCDPQTGEIAGWAREILDRSGGYAEVSPSGTGVHILAQGGGPGLGPRNHRGVGRESCDRRRYYTVTGERLRGEES